MRHRFIAVLFTITAVSQLFAQNLQQLEQQFKDEDDAITSFTKELAKWNQGVQAMKLKATDRLIALSERPDFVRSQAVEMYINASVELVYCQQYEALLYGSNLPVKMKGDMAEDNRKKISEQTEIALRLLDILSRLPAPVEAKSKLPK